MNGLSYFIFICWVLFWIYWLISATTSKRNVTSGFSRFVAARIVFIVIVVLLAHFSVLRNHLSNYGLRNTNNTALYIIGTVLFVAGLSFAIWARRHLGKNWGMPMSLKKDPELVTSGPYHYVRHPIYTGILSAMLGTALIAGLIWLFVLLIASAYFIYSATVEEKIMIKEFPKAYPSYKKTTKMLIPFIF
jgi:protein-S-isoprenylcysteine O-methyltransferase Ste14